MWAISPAYNLVPPGIANFPGGNASPFATCLMASAATGDKQLMHEAGFGPDSAGRGHLHDPLHYPVRPRGSGGHPADVCAYLYRRFHSPFDASIFYDTIQAHDFDLAQAGWQADFDDAATFLEMFRTGNGNNWGQYSNPDFDALLDAAQQVADIKSRGENWRRRSAFAPGPRLDAFVFLDNTNLVRPYVKGWFPTIWKSTGPLDFLRPKGARRAFGVTAR